MTRKPSSYHDLNDKSVVVDLIQERLVELGYLENPISGIYDENTRNAIIKFQKKHFPSPKGSKYIKNRMWAAVHWDGYVGPITWQYLWEKIYFKPSIFEYLTCFISSNIYNRLSPGWSLSTEKKKDRYGFSEEIVKENIVIVDFLGQKAEIHRLHLDQLKNVEKHIRKYEEKKKLDEYNLSKIRTFGWRPSRGSTEISSHSFGTAIDVYDNIPKYVKRAFKKEGARIIDTHIEF